jgi:hypothetical protein
MLERKGQKWLKSFHILFSSLWVTGGISACLLLLLDASKDGQLYGINQAIHFIDVVIIVIGNVGVILTGLIYSIYTKWGWFKHKWITVKWIITIAGMLFGTFFLGPWVNTLVDISKTEGLNAYSNPDYMHALKMITWFGTIQALSVVFALFISSLKPWSKKKRP